METSPFTIVYKYLRENNPEALLVLKEASNVTWWLLDRINAIEEVFETYKGQPEYIIEEACLNELAKEARPSKYGYILKILEEEFEIPCTQFLRAGVLEFEITNLMSECEPVFEAIGFTHENEDSNDLRNAVTGTISEYLEKREA